MLKILLNGCNGRMGTTIRNMVAQKESIKIVAGCDLNPSSLTFPVYNNIKECKEVVDVVIDFSHPSALDSVIEFCQNTKTPLVEATTGLSTA